MSDLRWSDLAAQVVAWHNRNPLARRISVMHLHSLGYVMLPFADASARPHVEAVLAPAGGEPIAPEAASASLRERAVARARRLAEGVAAQADDAPPLAPPPAALRPAFDEDFFPPFSQGRLRRFAARHAVAQSTPRGDVPVRRVKAESGLSAAAQFPRWLLTAQVDLGRTKTRVLVGAGDSPRVLGRRIVSPGRTLTVFALLGVMAGVASWVLDPPMQGHATARSAAAAATPASSVVATASAAAASVLLAQPSRSAPAPAAAVASSPASAPAAASMPGAPIDVEPQLGRVELPPIGPRVDQRRRAALAALGASAPLPNLGAPAATGKPAAQLAFAVSTRLMRTRSESDQVATAMRELLSKQAGASIRVEVVPAGDDWRVVGFPYAERNLAEKARALLASRGMKVQVIEF